MRQGATLIELLVVVAIIAAICGLGLPRLLRHLDRTHVRHATGEIVATLALARTAALAREAHVTTHFDPASSIVVVTVGGDTIALRALGHIHGVRIRSNRDSTVYGPTGLGYGAANQPVIIERRRAMASVVLSRLVRVRR